MQTRFDFGPVMEGMVEELIKVSVAATI